SRQSTAMVRRGSWVRFPPPALRVLPTRRVDYSRAKDGMFVHTDVPQAPWWVVEADDKRRARINCMAHVLTQIPWSPKALPTSSCRRARQTKDPKGREPAGRP